MNFNFLERFLHQSAEFSHFLCLGAEQFSISGDVLAAALIDEVALAFAVVILAVGERDALGVDQIETEAEADMYVDAVGLELMLVDAVTDMVVDVVGLNLCW